MTDSKTPMPETVAVVFSDYALFWAGSGPIAPLCERTGAKVGSQLITTGQAEVYAAAKVREALEEAAQIAFRDNMSAWGIGTAIRALIDQPRPAS